MSASRSAVSSQPADSRTKPSGTESPPQRRAPLRDRVDAAEAGRVRHELGAGEEPLGARLAAEVERDDHAVAVHLAPGDLVTRVVGRPG